MKPNDGWFLRFAATASETLLAAYPEELAKAAGYIAAMRKEIVRCVKASWPTWISEYYKIKGRWAGRWGQFEEPPWLLVMHSGSKSAGVAEYFKNSKRKVVTHFAWSSRHKGFVQCCSLKDVGAHAGGCHYLAKSGLNFCSIGIECPGPWNMKRDDEQMAKTRRLVEDILKVYPTITHVVAHSDIKSTKKDPGPGFVWDWLDGLGLKGPHTEL